MRLAFDKRATLVSELVDGLIHMLKGPPAGSHAAAWALCWLSHNFNDYSPGIWRPTSVQLEAMLEAMLDESADKGAVLWINCILGFARYRTAIDALISKLDETDIYVRRSAAEALGHMDDSRAMEALLAIRHETDVDVRRAAVKVLRFTSDDEIDRRLLAKNFYDSWWDSLDPQQSIDEERIKKAAKKLELPVDEVRRRYEEWSRRSQGLIQLTWKTEDS